MKRKKRWTAGVCALVFLLLCATAAAAAGGTPGAVLRAKDGVVRIFTYGADGDFSGTGFAISNGRSGALIVTNQHVVEGCSEYELYYDGNGPVKLKIAAVSEIQDICVLKTDHKLKGLTPLPLADKVQSGEAVYTLGYPGSADYLIHQTALSKEEMTVTNGIVSAVQSANTVGSRARSVKILQTNADINEGNSGGPMLNEKGQIVGVNTMGIDKSVASGINGAVHVDELRSFLDLQGIRYKTGFSPFWAAAAVLAALAAVGAALFFLRRRKRRAPVPALRGAEQGASAALPCPPQPDEEQLEGQISLAAAAEAGAAPPAARAFAPLPEGEVEGQISLFGQSAPAPMPAPAPAAAFAADAGPGPQGAEKKEKKTAPKKRRRWVIPAAAALVVLLAAGGFAWYTWDVYTDLEDAWNYKNYGQVTLCYRRAPWVEVWAGSEAKLYSQAMVKVENYELEEAIELFTQLDGYGDAATQIGLAKKYIRTDALSEKTRLVGKYTGFEKLGNYLDSEKRAETLRRKVYERGIKEVEAEEFSEAEKYFEVLPQDYEETEFYSLLVKNYHDIIYNGNPGYCYAFAVGCNVAGMEVPSILTDTYLDMFIQGFWTSSNGWWFEKTERHYDSNLGIYGFYYFRDGGMYNEQGKKVVSFLFWDADHMRLIYDGYYCDMTRMS